MSNSLLPLSTLADTIKAHIAAGDKAVGKAEEHYTAAGIHLLEAKERVKRTANLTWPAFLVSQCSIQRSRADELISIAEGKKTLEEVRAGNRERNSRRRERPSSAVAHGKSSEILQEKQSSPLVEDGQGEIEKLKKDLATAQARVGWMITESELLRAENNQLITDKELLQAAVDRLTEDNDWMRADDKSRSDWLAASDLVASDSGRSTDEIIRTEFAIEFRQTMVFEGYGDEPEAQQPEHHLTYVDFQAAGSLLGQCAAKNVIKKLRGRQSPDKAALAALRKRAQALGYKTIHRRGDHYHLVNLDGANGAGGEGLDGMAATLDYMEAFEAGAVQVFTTACGAPMSACDKNGPIELDDPRAVEAFARLAA